MSREWETLDYSALNEMSLSHPPLKTQGAKEKRRQKFEEPEVMDNSKDTVSSRHNRCTYELTETDTQRPPQTQTR